MLNETEEFLKKQYKINDKTFIYIIRLKRC